MNTTTTTNELRDYVAQIRTPKGDYIGGLGRDKAYIGKFDILEGGLFNSEQDFNEFILSDLVGTALKLLRHYLKHALYEGHEIVFTHADLALRNILIHDNGHVTAILDWEYGGWYPEHWEYVKALRTMNRQSNWAEYLPTILPPCYEKEYVGMLALNQLLRH